MGRLTASNFGSICKAVRRDMDVFARSLTSSTNIKAPAILHGQKYELVAVEEFEKKMKIKTSPCGLFVSGQHPCLAASPDRVIDANTILEVKCPFSAKDKPISPLTVPYLKEVNGSLTLNESHDYFYQVQGQLFCSNRQTCFFIVYTLCDVKILKINRNDKFIENMLKSLLDFYSNHFKKIILEKFMYRDYYSHDFHKAF